MKKIYLYIDVMQLGGANRVMANLAEFFSNKGYEVTLINDILPDADIPEYAVPAEVERRYLHTDAANVWVKNMHRMKALRKLVREGRPDVLLSFMGPPNVRALLATLGLSVRRIVSVRNDPYREYGSGLRKVFARFLFRMADGIVFQTEDAAAYFPQSVRKKSKVIYNPVNPKFYDRHWRPSGHEIAVIGRLQPQKNPMLAIRAFALIADRVPACTLDFYGDGEMRPELEAYAREQQLESRIRFHGRTSESDRVLADAAAYVLSSDFEGMPNALMEAMAVGTPAVSTDCPCGGPRALIEREEQGLLVPCGDEAALAQALLTVLTDEARRLRMSAAAAERARQFRPDIVLNEWEAFLNRE